jgi:penicillin-binding protein 1A
MAERKQYRKIYQKNKKRNRLIFLFKIFFSFFFLLIFIFISLFIYYTRDFPRPERFSERKLIQSSKIYDRTGKILLYEIYGEEKRTWVSLDKIPDYLKKAIISVEDKNFYSHFGIDFKAIFRSILVNLKIGKPLYGGSTIPQQLVRSTFLSNEKTIDRKIKEIVLSIELDRRYSKDQILEYYLNQIPLGQNCYGVEAASQTYFGKSVSEISLSEAAVLAALIKAPSLLSPYGEKKEELLARKDYVLDRMVEQGYLNKEEAEKAKKEEIKFLEKKTKILAPHFTLWVKQNLENLYGKRFLEEEGLKIYTTLDWELQKLAEKSVVEGMEKNKIFNAYNASLVAIDPKTGQVLALVGSAIKSEDWPGKKYPEDCQEGKNCLFEPEFNVAVSLPGRQPGSAFKPFIYAAAFEKGYDDKFIISDDFTNFGLWGGKEYYPENYDGKFRGNVTLREALAQSLNIPSIKVLYLVGSKEKLENLLINDFKGKEEVFLEGLKESISLAKEMGIKTLEKPVTNYGPSIVLGGGEVKLLEMVNAFSVFANDGLFIPYDFILKIEDAKGNLIYENKKIPERILSTKTAELITDILSDNEARAPIFGLRSPLYFEGFKVAVKTGTTQNYKDAWTIGYTPSISVGVWVGNNDGTPIKKPGVMAAAPIFHSFLEKILKGPQNEVFKQP